MIVSPNLEDGVYCTLGRVAEGGDNIIHYYHSIKKDNMTLSVDNVVLDASVSGPNKAEMLMSSINKLHLTSDSVNVVHWNGTKPGTFREQFSVRVGNDTSFWLGVGLNGKAIQGNRCRMEFNPNKVASSPIFWTALDLFRENTRDVLRHVNRFDLAIDLPVDRQRCFLVKDARMYIERRHGKEFTQYLGARSSCIGRVKLYNKQLEAGLDYPLTRLELTLNPHEPYEDIRFPTVYVINATNVGDKAKVTETERFILGALLQGYGSLNDLGRKTRTKIQMLMKDYVTQVEIAAKDYEAIRDQLAMYL